MLRTLFKQNITHGRHILKRTLYPSIYNSRYSCNAGYQKDCMRDESGLPIESFDEYKQKINKYRQKINKDTEKDTKKDTDEININKYVAKNILNDSKLIALFGTSAVGYNMLFTSLGDAGYVVGPYVLGSVLISHLFGMSAYSLLKDNYVTNNNDDIENNTYRYIIAGSYGAVLSPLIFCNPETLNLCTLVGLSYISASVSSNYFLNRNTSSISRGTYPLHLAGWTSIIGFYTLNPEYFESVYTFLNNIYTSA